MKNMFTLLCLAVLVTFPRTGGTLCITDNEQTIENFHCYSEASSCCEDSYVMNDKGHPVCVDIEVKPLSITRVKAMPLFAFSLTIPFKPLWSKPHVREPLPFYRGAHDLPIRIGLKLKKTAVIIC